MAIFIAVFIEIITVISTVIMFMAAASDPRGDASILPTVWIFLIGTAVSVAVFFSHGHSISW